MNHIRCRPGVDDDIYELAKYLLGHSEDVARRFADAAQKTLKDLVRMPGVGSLKEFDDPDLIDIRSWRVEGFPNHLIYYMRVEEGIDVLAVLHGARDAEPRLKSRL